MENSKTAEKDVAPKRKLTPPHTETDRKKMAKRIVGLSPPYRKTLKLSKSGVCIWSGHGNTHVYVGMQDSPTVLSCHADGTMVTHDITRGKSINRGIMVSPHKCILITSEEPRDRTVSISTFAVSLDHTKSSPIDPINKLDITQPADLFIMPKQKLGFFCLNPSRIEVFSQTDAVTKATPRATEIIALPRHPNPTWGDRVSVDTEGVIYIGSVTDNVVYTYSSSGEPTKTISQPDSCSDHPLYTDFFIKSLTYDEGGVVVVCYNGGVYRHTDRWSMVCEKDQTDVWSWDGVVSNNLLWRLTGTILSGFNTIEISDIST